VLAREGRVRALEVRSKKSNGTQRVSEHSGVPGQGPRKGCKGATREIATRWARLSTTVVFPQKGHYPRTGALIL
jgi:hypothetical protein